MKKFLLLQHTTPLTCKETETLRQAQGERSSRDIEIVGACPTKLAEPEGPDKRSMGFSLLEVMVVLALVVLTVSIGFLYIRLSKSMYVQVELDRVYALFKLTQHRARVDGCSYELVINEKEGTFKTPFFNEKLMADVELGITPGVQGPPSAPTQLLKRPVTFIGSKVVFDAQGIIQPGTVYFTDKVRSCLYALTVSVSPVPFIRRYKYDKKWIVL